MANLTSNELLRINEALKKFLQAESVKVRDIPSGTEDEASKGVEVTVEDAFGDDLEAADFKEIAEGVNDEVKEFMSDKYKLNVLRVTVKNSDSGRIENLFNKVKASMSRFTKAELTEDKTKALEILMNVRTVLQDAFDNLVDVESILLKNKKLMDLGTDLHDDVIAKLDGGKTSIISDIRKTIKALKNLR